MTAIARFWELSWSDRLRAVEAFAFLGLARMAVLTVPFRLLARTLGQASISSEEPAASDAAAPATLALGALVERVSNHTPWKSNCLAQAFAATFMLRRRGVKTMMYFGVAKNDKGELEAHAWIRCGKTILTGRNRVGRYGVVAIFSKDPRAL